jgi:hypothetical protein
MNFYLNMINLWKQGLIATGQDYLIGCGTQSCESVKVVKQQKVKSKQSTSTPTPEMIKQEIKVKKEQLRKEGDRRRKAMLNKEIEVLDKQWYKLMVAEKQQQELF